MGTFTMNDRDFIKQLKKFIDEQLAEEPETEEPKLTIVQSSQVIYTMLSELSKDVQNDYARADKETKKRMEKKLDLKPSEEVK
jgi:hypothetical protein